MGPELLSLDEALEKLAELDRINPQISARIATTFRAWRSFERGRRSQLEQTLRQLSEIKGLSKDLQDIVDRSLK